MIYQTTTGERVREQFGLIDVGLSDGAQAALGHLLHVQLPQVGQSVDKGQHLFVVEGSQTAAEFYSPVDGYVDTVTDDPNISDWLVTLKPRKI